MPTGPDRFVQRLVDSGLSEALVRASLPDWWTLEEYHSTSARTLVSLLLARRLSLDPETLLDDSVPIGFLYTGPIKFKHMRLAAGDRRDALVAFAQGVSRIVFSVLPAASGIPVPENPADLRAAILQSGRPHVGFGDVVATCWSLGVPVLHLRLFPAKTKGVTAIAVRLGDRHAILVARESGLEAQYMFHIAHELGHIALGHLRNAAAIVDADPSDPDNKSDELIDDDEERAADAYTQTLLTGSPTFEVVRDTLRNSSMQSGSAKELAKLSLQVGAQYGIDAGHIIMCFGYSTGDWGLAMAASKLIPGQPEKPGTLVNRVLWQQLGANGATSQSAAFLQAVAPV